MLKQYFTRNAHLDAINYIPITSANIVGETFPSRDKFAPIGDVVMSCEKLCSHMFEEVDGKTPVTVGFIVDLKLSKPILANQPYSIDAKVYSHNKSKVTFNCKICSENSNEVLAECNHTRALIKLI